MTIRQAFAAQGRACAALGSPFMGRLMPLVGDRLTADSAVGDRILGWTGDPSPAADNAPLRLAGALHALKIEGRALQDVYPPADVDDDTLWNAVVNVMSEHAAQILQWLDQPPQTNEVRRAAAILPALAEVAAREPGTPIGLLELGASGGLNLRADHFRLITPNGALGDAASDMVLHPDWTGPEPPAALPRIVSRKGVDLNPLDPADPEDQLRLRAYLWPDQPERLALTDAAIRIAGKVPVSLMRGDAAAWIETELAPPVPDHLPVVLHTVAWQYFPETVRARIETALRQAPGPVYRFGMEADGQKPGAGMVLTRYPDGVSWPLGRVDFHGRWVRYL
ncbi:MAG: DUF2332 family protein [Pseudomonadota bacterium]